MWENKIKKLKEIIKNAVLGVQIIVKQSSLSYGLWSTDGDVEEKKMKKIKSLKQSQCCLFLKKKSYLYIYDVSLS